MTGGEISTKSLMTWNEKSKRWFKKYRKHQYVISCKQLKAPATKEGSVEAANRWWRLKKMKIDNKRQVSRRYQADWEEIVFILRAKAEWLTKHSVKTSFLLERGEALYKRMVVAVSQMDKNLQPEYAARTTIRIGKLRRIVSELTDNHVDESKECLETAEFFQKMIDSGGELLDPKPFIEQFPEVFNLDDEWMDRLVYLTSEAPGHANTVGAQVDRWLKMQEARDISSDRYKAYFNAINTFRRWIGYDKPLEEITGERLESYKIYLLQKVAKREDNPTSTTGMTLVYAEEQMNVAKKFVKWLRRQDLIPHLSILYDRNALRIKKRSKAVEIK